MHEITKSIIAKLCDKIWTHVSVYALALHERLLCYYFLHSRRDYIHDIYDIKASNHQINVVI